MKKLPKYLSTVSLLAVVLGAFSLPYSVRADTYSQLINDTVFTVKTYSAQAGVNVFSDIGYIATSSITGFTLQLWVNDYTASSTYQKLQVCIYRYPSEISYKEGIPGSSAIYAACSSTGVLGADGFVTYSFQGSAQEYQAHGFPFYYAINVSGATSNTELLGSVLATGHTLLSNSTGNPSFPFATSTSASFYYQFLTSGSQPTQYFTPSPTFSGFSTSTLSDFCQPADNILDVGGGVRYGLCTAVSFLFVPTPESIQQWQSIPNTARQKIPFSYYYDFSDILNDSSASSTENFQSFSIDFSSIDFSSSTPLGPILPQTNFEFLSSSTISQYMPPGMHDTMFFLARSAIWVAVLVIVYRRIVPYKPHI